MRELEGVGAFMKKLRKKAILLACTTTMTVCMSSVAMADTIKLSDGTSVDLGADVKAVSLSTVMYDKDEYGHKTEAEIIKGIESQVRDSLNKKFSEKVGSQFTPYTGPIYTGVPQYYQLQGEDKLGHHTAYLGDIGIAKEAYQYFLDQEAKATGQAPINLEMVDMALLMSGGEATQAELDRVNTHFSEFKYDPVMRAQLKEKLMTKPGLTEDDKLTYSYIAELLPLVDLKFTKSASNRVKTDRGYGLANRIDLRGDIGFGGFVAPLGMRAYVIPTKASYVTSFGFMNDTSYDYWSNKLGSAFENSVAKEPDNMPKMVNILSKVDTQINTLAGKMTVPSQVDVTQLSDSALLDVVKDIQTQAHAQAVVDNKSDDIKETAELGDYLKDFGKLYDVYQIQGHDETGEKTALVVAVDMREALKEIQTKHPDITLPINLDGKVEMNPIVEQMILLGVNQALPQAQQRINNSLAKHSKPGEEDTKITLEDTESMRKVYGTKYPTYILGTRVMVEEEQLQFPFYVHGTIVLNDSKPTLFVILTSDVERHYVKPVWEQLISSIK